MASSYDKRIFIFEIKYSQMNMYTFVFYSKNLNLTPADFKRALKQTFVKLMQKYNKKNPYDLLRIKSFFNDFYNEMNRIGFGKVVPTYLTSDEIFREV